MSKFDHSGSSFDSFLEEEGIREEVEATAMKRVIAWQIEQAMQAQQKSKLALARDMNTSRSQVNRLLDPADTGTSLATIARAASALGKRMSINLSNKTPAIAAAQRRRFKPAAANVVSARPKKRPSAK